ncbi:hypothetical protein [Thiomicrorhabdus indica]|uniref:hypothetical protein n=1 Tax=Thiomicrorhabdus indica TaxID=2267253 RepID=UPI00102DCC28|nr:hypothetical protein [Thiomicrorhabdus indica]
MTITKLKSIKIDALHYKHTINFIILIVLVLILFTGILEPHLEKIDDCVKPITIQARDLQIKTGTDSFYYHSSLSNLSSYDSNMAIERNIDGYIYPGRLTIADDEMSVDEKIVLSGHLYIRKPSVLEILFNKTRKQRFLEITTKKGKYLLLIERFKRPAFQLCNAAM